MTLAAVAFSWHLFSPNEMNVTTDVGDLWNGHLRNLCISGATMYSQIVRARCSKSQRDVDFNVEDYKKILRRIIPFGSNYNIQPFFWKLPLNLVLILTSIFNCLRQALKYTNPFIAIDGIKKSMWKSSCLILT